VVKPWPTLAFSSSSALLWEHRLIMRRWWTIFLEKEANRCSSSTRQGSSHNQRQGATSCARVLSVPPFTNIGNTLPLPCSAARNAAGTHSSMSLLRGRPCAQCSTSHIAGSMGKLIPTSARLTQMGLGLPVEGSVLAHLKPMSAASRGILMGIQSAGRTSL